MSAGTYFFVCSCAILALSIVNLNVSPTFNVKVSEWQYNNCGILSDRLDKYKSGDNPSQEKIETFEIAIRTCRVKKLMYTLEQGTFIINLGVGLIGVLFGLFGLEKEFKPKVGIIGLILGILGFILSLGYTIINGVVFTNYYEISIIKREEDSSFAITDGDSSYKCIFYNKENDFEALTAKFSDLMKSQYNYNYELQKSFVYGENYEHYGCNVYGSNSFSPDLCLKNGIIEGSLYYTDSDGQRKRCEKLYYFKSDEFFDYKNYDLGVRFLVCLIMSILTVICHVGLFIGAIKLFKES